MGEWEVTFEPLNVIAADDPVSCAIYARDNGFLSKEGWKSFKRAAFEQQKMSHMINKAKIKFYHAGPKFKYEFDITKDISHAVKLNHQNGNTNLQDAFVLEMQ